MQEEKKGEMVYLTEKSDVLNGFLSDHQIESELLCVEKLNFIISWGVMKKDLSMKIVRNSNVLEVPATGLSFTSKDDLNDRVLPKLHKDVLNDEQVLVKMDELVLMQKEFEQSIMRSTNTAAKMHP